MRQSPIKHMETGSSAVNSCPSMIFIMRSAIHSINRRLLGSATNRAERVLDSYWKKRDRLRTNPHRSFPLDGPRLESFKTIVQRLPGFASIPPPDQIHWSYKPQTRFYIPFFAIGTYYLISHTGLRIRKHRTNHIERLIFKPLGTNARNTDLLIRDRLPKRSQICSSSRAGIRLLRVMT